METSGGSLGRWASGYNKTHRKKHDTPQQALIVEACGTRVHSVHNTNLHHWRVPLSSKPSCSDDESNVLVHTHRFMLLILEGDWKGTREWGRGGRGEGRWGRGSGRRVGREVHDENSCVQACLCEHGKSMH